VKINREALRRHWQFWTLTGVAALTLLLVLVNIGFFIVNRSIQTEVNTRQQFISQTVPLERLNREIVNALANLAVRNNDEQLKQLLDAHGIRVTVNPPAAGPTKGQQ
jgi:Tfp pilus assembly protein PilN